MGQEITNLIGHYQFKNEELDTLNSDEREKPVLHVISVDQEDLLALVDFDANPEWLEISSLEEEEICILDKKYKLNLKEETYCELDSSADEVSEDEEDEYQEEI